ncbi:cobaltochelatase subunit CobN [Aurantimonas sp. Leaf443]|uniref:cobaltochelatase subunit CobN n=1 Tax=Aurantimonas sp. Leaf443 TaxID=1736378 RepID=UPI0006FBCDFF|nr:cobaltochelatase subunit CobN [Aurantimonas sp. Leaf443]KQT88204.1 cobalamin biosynthesis protein CobN [Aurantimonas sp. Leaf443]
MHLLLARQGALDEGGEAIDLGQSPAQMLVLSAADTEIAALGEAKRRLGARAPELRLANLLSLRHPMSVDAYVERTARHARLVVVRLLGGASYWPYGLEALLANARRSGAGLVVLPGDDRPDAGLDRFNTVPEAERIALWRYLLEGGADNAERFLLAGRALIDGGAWPDAAQPLARAGVLGGEAMFADGAKGTRPLVALVFYRALLQSGQMQAVEALAEALERRGCDVARLFVSGLKDPVSVATLRRLFSARAPGLVVNLTGFAVSSPGAGRVPTVLDETGAMVLQAVLSSGGREAWEASARGLSARDLAMSVALPEVDGRVMTRAVAFKAAAAWDAATQTNLVAHAPVADRVAFVAELAARWLRLGARTAAERRVAILLANYPNRDGRLGNGVGLDTPAGTIEVMTAMGRAGYDVGTVPADGDALIAHLMEGPTNAGTARRTIRETLPLVAYRAFFDTLPAGMREAVTQRWGAPEADPFMVRRAGALCFALPLARFGATMVGIQPARGYNIDPKETYHSPDLVPPHNYIAFYAFLRTAFDADAIVHMGKHGNLEWLPGKALALSRTCFPEAVFGPVPHLYPFIVNDPGEGTQAKRRASAVIIDHLTPPLTRAENHGILRDLEALVDEFYAASEGDAPRAALLKTRILDLVRDTGLDLDAGLDAAPDAAAALERLDAYLCDLKEMQIRDGLHVFGRSPEGRLRRDLVVALARLPRGEAPGEASILRALADDLGLDAAKGEGRAFDPLDCDMAAPWTGARPQVLNRISTDPWRSAGDTVERLELLAAKLVEEGAGAATGLSHAQAVLESVETRLGPALDACGAAEIEGLLTGLSGRFVAPGPSGAPTRGRPEVLPTGRNFFSVDTRAVPTEAAWTLGRCSAELLVTRHLQDHGDWPKAIGLTAWGTSNMRTGGDDIAQALALIGARPAWDRASGRVTGFEVLTLAELGRPRVDVTLRISGFFRDAFPDQIALFDRASRAVGALREEGSENPLAQRMAEEAQLLVRQGMAGDVAGRLAGRRVYGSRPGAYGAGLQALIDERGWRERGDLAEAYIVWGAYAYGADGEGEGDRAGLERRLSRIEAVVQNQDNREHDLLDSDDYYQFEGGMSAAAEHLNGRRPVLYHNDHSRPERPVIRTLEEEIGRVVRARATNPKWLAGVMRHGYKGAFEIAATVDYLFAFAATTGAVRDHHFEAVYYATLGDEAVRAFIADHNAPALAEIAERLAEAIDRGLWVPRSNAARADLSDLSGTRRTGEGNRG